MNPPKPINTKPYVPKAPRIIRTAKTPADRRAVQRKMKFDQKHISAKTRGFGAGKAWKQRVSNQYSQAAQAGTVSTLLRQK